MIDFDNEQVISFAEAARLVPTGVHRATISRWCQTGVRGVRLAGDVIGGRRVTSKEALERFLAACRANNRDGMDTGPWIESAMDANEWLRSAATRPDRD